MLRHRLARCWKIVLSLWIGSLLVASFSGPEWIAGLLAGMAIGIFGACDDWHPRLLKSYHAVRDETGEWLDIRLRAIHDGATAATREEHRQVLKVQRAYLKSLMLSNLSLGDTSHYDRMLEYVESELKRI